MREPWSTREVNILKFHYRSRGSKGCLAALQKAGFNRTLDSVRWKAQRLGLRLEANHERFKLVPLADAHSLGPGRGAHPRIIAAAERDGVLARGGTGWRTYYAPPDWIDGYVRMLEEEEAQKRIIITTWLRTHEAAQLFGVNKRDLSTLSGVNNTKKGELVRLISTVEQKLLMINAGTTTTLTRFWHPQETHEAAIAYRKWRATSPWYQARRKKRQERTCVTSSSPSRPSSSQLSVAHSRKMPSSNRES